MCPDQALSFPSFVIGWVVLGLLAGSAVLAFFSSISLCCGAPGCLTSVFAIPFGCASSQKTSALARTCSLSENKRISYLYLPLSESSDFEILFFRHGNEYMSFCSHRKVLILTFYFFDNAIYTTSFCSPRVLTLGMSSFEIAINMVLYRSFWEVWTVWDFKFDIAVNTMSFTVIGTCVR